MDFLTALNSGKTILFDGGMGTQLGKYGLELSGGKNNLTNPDTVLRVHREYAESGAEVLITNTFTMNPVYIETHHVEVDLEEVNRIGVNLARKAASGKQFVFGDMGSTGQMLQPFGNYTKEDFFHCFKKQAVILAKNGVDGFIIETMFDLEEALCALKACRETAGHLPVIVSFAISSKSDGGRTMMGQTLVECARKVAESGGSAVGANCGDLDPEELTEVVGNLRNKTDLPIIVQPNAGKPKLVAGKTIYDMSPEEFARGAANCVKAGANMVGGCCGTTPEHIKKLAEILTNK